MADSDYDIVLRFSRRYAVGHRLIRSAESLGRNSHDHDKVVILDIANASNGQTT